MKFLIYICIVGILALGYLTIFFIACAIAGANGRMQKLIRNSGGKRKN